MSRKSKIIVCISGIVVITLALLGFTFGFFLTQIQGNESSKSIEVVTGDAKIKFTDLSESDIDEIIEPGYEVVKPFTIENIGEGRATYSIYLVDVVNNFNRTQDLTYTLYRTNGIITDTIDKDTDFSKWDTLKENIVYPTTSGSIQSNEIVEDSASYTYALKITYINHPTESQNEDQGKIFQGSINIRATASETNPFAEGTLAYNILEDAYKTDSATPFVEYEQLGTKENTTIPSQSLSLAEEHILSNISDYYGTSYFYRGAVQNNYVLFNNLCWRIMRVEGDGSVKLIYAGEGTEGATTCNETTTTSGLINNGEYVEYGYKTVNINNTEKKLAKYNQDTGLGKALNDWFKLKFMNSDELTIAGKKLKEDTWCLGGKDNIGYNYQGDLLDVYTNNSYVYEAGNRILKGEIDLFCNNEDKIISKIGTLTADEATLAGLKYGSYDLITNYLYDNVNNPSSNSYWTLTRNDINSVNNTDDIFIIGLDGALVFTATSYTSKVRPVITIISSVRNNGGSGTITDPYVIE